MTQSILLSQARKRLAVVWFAGGGLVFLFFMFCTFGNAFGDKLPQAWGWFGTNLMPTLILIFSFIGREMMVERRERTHVSSFAFKMAFYSSIFYLVLVLVSLLLSRSYTLTHEIGSLAFLDRASTGLNPLQVLTAAALGGFFATEKKDLEEGGA